MFSVIIPVYNATKFLPQTVQSLLDQNRDELSIILVDDGSSDGSDALCDALAAQHPQITAVHQKNSGVSVARNTGIEYVLTHMPQVQYLAFLDADDLWTPDFLTADLVSQIADQHYSIYAFGGVDCNFTADRFAQPQVYAPSLTPGGQENMWKITTHFCAAFYHICLFRDHGIRFFPGYRYSEDKYFRLLCAYFAKDIAFMPQIMHIYRSNVSGAMQKVSKIKPIDYFLPIAEGWLKCEEFINQQLGPDTTDLGRVLANVYLLDMASEHCMRGGSLKKVMQVISAHPQYPCLLEMKPMGENDINYQKKELLLQHPLRFGLQYRVKGLMRAPMRWVANLPMMTSFYQKRRFPFQTISR